MNVLVILPSLADLILPISFVVEESVGVVASEGALSGVHVKVRSNAGVLDGAWCSIGE